MAKVNLNINELLQTVFGNDTQPFEFEDLPEKSQYGSMGSPYNGVDLYGKSYRLPVSLGGYDLPYPVIRVNGGNRIVETDLTEVRGSMKEFISEEDITITIQGLLIDNSGDYPEDQVKELLKLFRSGKTLELRSVISDLFLLTPDNQGETNVAVYNWNFPEAPGVKNVRGYEVVLKSDTPFDLYLEDE